MEHRNTSHVNLTALAEARAKMTPGEYEVAIGAYCAPAPHEACGIAVSSTEETGAAWVVQSDAHDECSHPIRRDDAAGLVAEHNAMPVLAEVARAALAYADEAGTRFGDLDLLLSALAKVSQ